MTQEYKIPTLRSNLENLSRKICKFLLISDKEFVLSSYFKSGQHIKLLVRLCHEENNI